MAHAHRNKLVYTVPDRCRVCYTCVRECPAKAIRIINGQAEIQSERCIGCGSCMTVCSQGAKAMVETKENLLKLLEINERVIACVAPSFPAEFTEFTDFRQFVGMIKALGFYKVVEVGFGADLVAQEYKKLDEKSDKNYITSDCPAIVFYIEHYLPHLTEALAPVASPMVAITRALKQKYGKHCPIVFIGPCVAKKAESDEIDDAITFTELRELWTIKNIKLKNHTPAEFDPPYSGKGSIFPVSKGLLCTVGKNDDPIYGNVVVASGSHIFKEALKEFEEKTLGHKHLEVLCCNGCIQGPGMTKDTRLYHRKQVVGKYVEEKLNKLDGKLFETQLAEFKDLDLSQSFQQLDRRLHKPDEKDIDLVLKSLGKFNPGDHLNCGACGYETCLEHAESIIQGLAENEMCLPYTIEKLHKSNGELNVANDKLASAQQQLIQSEKLASMGQLSAGIAHELNNPLGIITLYSNLLKETEPEDSQNFKDLELIAEQANRCKNIVGGLLNFARKNQVKYSELNLVLFAKRSIESVICPDNIEIIFNSDIKDPMAFIDEDQMMQVLTNLLRNAMDAIETKGKIELTLKDNNDSVIFEVKDNGIGISKENMTKIFTPFFTTKGVGKGTGLGLPLIYGIVKMHKGNITVESNADSSTGETGTTIQIVLPRINDLKF